MIERIPLSNVLDALFLAVSDEPRVFKNKRYRTVLTERYQTKKGEVSVNLIQCSSYEVRRQLHVKYAEDARGVSNSLGELALEFLVFGLADVRQDAAFLIFEHRKHGTPASLARWMKKNCSGDVLILEGSSRSRASFALEDDLLLTRLNFL